MSSTPPPPSSWNTPGGDPVPPPPPPTWQTPGMPYAGDAGILKPRGLSVAALVLGLVSLLFCGFVTGTLAIIFGAIAISKCNSGEYDGKGMAKAGLIIGIIGVIGWVAALIIVANSA